jgi:thiamine pyrophosphokinase
MKILIISGSAHVSAKTLKKLARWADKIICADSGGETARNEGIAPDAIIGDFDSISPDTLDYFRNMGGTELINLKEQESTDIEKAINLALQWGTREIRITGVSGRRNDHFLHTLGLLLRFKDQAEIILVDDDDIISLKCESFSETCHPGERVSLIPWGGTMHQVSTTGLKYPLIEENLIPGYRESISNETTGDDFQVRFKGGMIMLFREARILF